MKTIPRIIKVLHGTWSVIMNAIYIGVFAYTLNALFNLNTCCFHMLIGVLLCLLVKFAISLLYCSRLSLIVRNDMFSSVLSKKNWAFVALCITGAYITALVIYCFFCYYPHYVSLNTYDSYLLAYAMKQISDVEQATAFANLLHGFPTYVAEYLLSQVKESGFVWESWRLQWFISVHVFLLFICGFLAYISDMHRIYITDLLKLSNQENKENLAEEP